MGFHHLPFESRRSPLLCIACLLWLWEMGAGPLYVTCTHYRGIEPGHLTSRFQSGLWNSFPMPTVIRDIFFFNCKQNCFPNSILYVDDLISAFLSAFITQCLVKPLLHFQTPFLACLVVFSITLNLFLTMLPRLPAHWDRNLQPWDSFKHHLQCPHLQSEHFLDFPK